MGTFVYIEGHTHVSVEKISAGGHVVKESSDNGGEMNDVCRFIAFEYLLAFCEGAKVAVRTAEEYPVLGRSNYLLKSFSNEAGTTGDEYALHCAYVLNP